MLTIPNFGDSVVRMSSEIRVFTLTPDGLVEREAEYICDILKRMAA